jgi:hypothetical protein
MNPIKVLSLLLFYFICTVQAQVYNLNGWNYFITNGECELYNYTGMQYVNVTVPETLGGLPVKQVGRGWPGIAGNGYSETPLASVFIPSGVTRIGDSAFMWSPALQSISIPNTITNIGGSAFYKTGLKNILIPNSVTLIGAGAFQSCNNLTNITLPSSLSGIADSLLQDCTSLTNITLPLSIGSIGNSAFEGCTGLTSIIIPNSVTNIGNSAFEGCAGLTSIIIPNSVTRIGNSAFEGCAGLTSIIIPNSVTNIGNSAFAGCTGLTSIIIPSSVTSIGNSAFAGCTGLTSITMPDRFIAQVAQIGVSGQVATDYMVNALANNDAFVTAVANKIKETSGNYGIATQSGLSSAIEPLATKTQITTAINEGRAAGIASVTASPNTWSLFTSSQIQNMAIGDLVLTREVNGNFVLNYDIEQSNDLANWTVYSANTQIVKLPADKAFVRIKAKQ